LLETQKIKRLLDSQAFESKIQIGNHGPLLIDKKVTQLSFIKKGKFYGAAI
jgi:hypothetical protein